MSNHLSSRQILRQQMRSLRSQLSLQQQMQAAHAIISQSIDLIEYYHAKNLAFYLPFNGEISPLPLMEQLWARGKSLYLPVLHPFSQGNLLFLRYEQNSKLIPNRFGILEPKLDVRCVLPIGELEMIFTPLVACDKQGNRMGMGGGFYDRTLSQSPHLISVGLSHRCQQVTALPVESWDMPLRHLILG